MYAGRPGAPSRGRTALATVVVAFLTRQAETLVVETAASPREALDRLDADGPRIDCIVSDYDMPELDGIEFLQARIRALPNGATVGVLRPPRGRMSRAVPTGLTR